MKSYLPSIVICSILLLLVINFWLIPSQRKAIFSPDRLKSWSISSASQLEYGAISNAIVVLEKRGNELILKKYNKTSGELLITKELPLENNAKLYSLDNSLFILSSIRLTRISNDLKIMWKRPLRDYYHDLDKCRNLLKLDNYSSSLAFVDFERGKLIHTIDKSINPLEDELTINEETFQDIAQNPKDYYFFKYQFVYHLISKQSKSFSSYQFHPKNSPKYAFRSTFYEVENNNEKKIAPNDYYTLNTNNLSKETLNLSIMKDTFSHCIFHDFIPNNWCIHQKTYDTDYSIQLLPSSQSYYFSNYIDGKLVHKKTYTPANYNYCWQPKKLNSKYYVFIQQNEDAIEQNLENDISIILLELGTWKEYKINIPVDQNVTTDALTKELILKMDEDNIYINIQKTSRDFELYVIPVKNLR